MGVRPPGWHRRHGPDRRLHGGRPSSSAISFTLSKYKKNRRRAPNFWAFSKNLEFFRLVEAVWRIGRISGFKPASGRFINRL